MNLQAILDEIKTSLRIHPYKGSVYIREGELEAVLKIAYEHGKKSVTEDVESPSAVDGRKRKKV